MGKKKILCFLMIFLFKLVTESLYGLICLANGSLLADRVSHCLLVCSIKLYREEYF